MYMHALNITCVNHLPNIGHIPQSDPKTNNSYTQNICSRGEPLLICLPQIPRFPPEGDSVQGDPPTVRDTPVRSGIPLQGHGDILQGHGG